MKTAVILTCLLVAMASQVGGQDSWQDELKQDLVTIQDDKMVIESFSLDRISLPEYEPVELQVAYYSEAPTTGVISRDNFVAFTTTITVMTILGMFAEGLSLTASEFFDAYETQEIEQPIGRPDLEIKLFMTAEGFQLDLLHTPTDERTRITETWDDFFETEK